MLLLSFSIYVVLGVLLSAIYYRYLAPGYKDSYWWDFFVLPYRGLARYEFDRHLSEKGNTKYGLDWYIAKKAQGYWLFAYFFVSASVICVPKIYGWLGASFPGFGTASNWGEFYAQIFVGFFVGVLMLIVGAVAQLLLILLFIVLPSSRVKSIQRRYQLEEIKRLKIELRKRKVEENATKFL